MSRSRVLGIAAVATALLGVMLAVASNLWLSAKAYEPLATMQSLVVIANFSDGSTSPSLMYKMINNMYHSALRGFVTLKQPPYPVVDVKLFNNTLVTFKLPSGFKYRYASIVIHGNRIYVYEFNSAQDYKLYAVVSRPIASVTIKIIYPKTKVGNATLLPVGTFNAEKFEVPLPGTDANIDPIFQSYSAVWYSSLGQLIENTTATSWFFIVPYQEVNSILVDGSAYPRFLRMRYVHQTRRAQPTALDHTQHRCMSMLVMLLMIAQSPGYYLCGHGLAWMPRAMFMSQRHSLGRARSKLHVYAQVRRLHSSSHCLTAASI
jgi:hypothetical protein